MAKSLTDSQALLNSVSGAALITLIWEWFITFDDEVELIWSKPKKSWVKWLFLFARYYVLAASLVTRALEAAVIYEYRINHTCMKIWYSCQVIVSLHAMCSLEIILMARVYALYGKPIWMKFLFFSLVLAENIAILIGILINWPDDTFSLDDVVDRLPSSFSYFGICTLIIQVTIMWLTISKYSHASWKTVPVLRLMFRDGSLAFTILTVLVLGMCVLTIRHKPYAVAGNSWLLAAVSGVTCRIITNMLKLVPSRRNHSNSASAGIQFTTIITSERSRTFDFSEIDNYDFSRAGKSFLTSFSFPELTSMRDYSFPSRSNDGDFLGFYVLRGTSVDGHGKLAYHQQSTIYFIKMATISDRLAVKKKIGLPFGAWPQDVERSKLPAQPQIVQRVSTGYNTQTISIYKKDYFATTIDVVEKYAEVPSVAFFSSVHRTLALMILAGEECTPQPVGRIFDSKGALCGFIQPAWYFVAPAEGSSGSQLKPPRGFLPSKKGQVEAIKQLIERLHTKGIVHGQIAPDVLITLRNTFSLKLFDFSAAVFEDDDAAPLTYKARYSSPSRMSTLGPGAEPSFPSLKALIFDLGDVLFQWSPETKTSISPKTLRLILNSPTWHDYERGKLSEQDCYDQVGAQFGFPPDEIRACFDQARDSLVGCHNLIRTIRDIKDRAYEPLPIYAMSNISLPDWEVLKTKPADWAIFDRIFTSGAAGARKPDLEFYQHVIEETGVDPAKTLFVDDKVENVEAAKSAGLQAIVFESEEFVQNYLVTNLRPSSERPITQADDLYATGITMYAIASGFEGRPGFVPFRNVPSQDGEFRILEDFVASGFCPSIYAVVDPDARDMLIDSWAPGAVLVCAPLNDPTPSTRLDLSHNPCVNKAGFAQILAEYHLGWVNIDGCNLSTQDTIDLLKTQPALFRGVEAIIHLAFLSLENLDPYDDASLGIPSAFRLYYGGETFRDGSYGWVSLPFFGTDQLIQNLADFVDIHANHGLATLPNPANLRSIFGSSYRDGEKSWAARELQMIPVENECTSLVDGYSLFFIPHLRWRIFDDDVDPLKGFDYGFVLPGGEHQFADILTFLDHLIRRAGQSRGMKMLWKSWFESSRGLTCCGTLTVW